DDAIAEPPVFSESSKTIIDQGLRNILGRSFDNYATLHATGGNELYNTVAGISNGYKSAELNGGTADYKLTFENVQTTREGDAGAEVTFDEVTTTNVDEIFDNPAFDTDYHVTAVLNKVPDANGDLTWVISLPEMKTAPYDASGGQ
ncbi:hypothetical protein KDA23_06945, partial [Candidatus Saccharibacteria bacterium]|nr:hypothetical protein [Candidatus Saccharibacteria bacterium]